MNKYDPMEEDSSSSSTWTNENESLLNKHSSGKGKATPWHILGPIFLVTFGIGALMAPMVQFYTEIFCDRYYDTETDASYDVFGWMMGNNNSSNSDTLPDIKDCAIPEIQQIVATVQGILMFLTSGSSLLVAGFYGSLSDRHGRKVVFQIFSIGGILTMLCYIAAAKSNNLIGVTLLILAPLVRGFLSSEHIVIAAIQAYISDCTTHEARTVAFGRMMGATYAGVIFGPMAASLLMAKTGTVVSPFYLALVIHSINYLYIVFFLPESLDEQLMKITRRNATEQPKPKFWKRVNIFSGFGIFFKAKPHHISRFALPILATIQFLTSIVLQPPILLYAMLEFKWTAYEGGLLVSIMCLIRFTVITIALPYLKRRMNTYWTQRGHHNHTMNDQQIEDYKTHHRILFDTWMIRSGLAVDVTCLILAALATTGSSFAFSVFLNSFAVLAHPCLKSLFTTLVDPSEIAALLSAQAVLESIAAIISQSGINLIYSASVRTMPSLFLYVCASISFLGFVLAFLIHPVKDQNSPSTP
ncbi:major facilitator superfamily domain-containing protein [Halteromyces radiatus]|uniref:major facilitator superfamily domain-containing protein n=1 Tax=Halteromyces radiatus TaxID=101107 RepID=UPI00221FA58A|nr:major facilitator superfamily domain-containing protein [Halteromyces radiatus]KAI8089543.1 major facilitator superfamily domain-containing protein [Halteromyces radiatus]